MNVWKRAIIKSISWRIIGIVILFILAYVITGDIQETSILTIIFHSIRVVLYVFHEYIWERIWPL